MRLCSKIACKITRFAIPSHSLNLSFSQIVGIIAAVERVIADADERVSQFFLRLLDKQLIRLRGSFERHVVSLDV